MSPGTAVLQRGRTAERSDAATNNLRRTQTHRRPLSDAAKLCVMMLVGSLKWTPKLRPAAKLGFSRSARREKEQIDETKTQAV